MDSKDVITVETFTRVENGVKKIGVTVEHGPSGLIESSVGKKSVEECRVAAIEELRAKLNPPEPPPTTTSREAFETKFERRLQLKKDVRSGTDYTYVNSQTQLAWSAWKAGIAYVKKGGV